MSQALINALQNQAAYPHPTGEFQLFETHISWVVTTGEFAYKIKKPIDFGFLDFSTLDKRKQFCEKEVLLNQRLAPELYLEVAPIYGDEANPSFSETGPAIDYAVKMRQFDQSQLFDNLLAENALTPQHMTSIADALAKFHQTTVLVDAKSNYGSPRSIHKPILDNFDVIEPLINDKDTLARLDKLKAWSQGQFTELKSIFHKRKEDGFIRECHGDIHLDNIALIDDKATIFDCIEFNDLYRCIDVMSDVAFMVMDLLRRDLSAYAYRLLNRYLEHTGDYDGLAVFNYYLCYRAMVRAKIAVLRLNNAKLSTKEQEETMALFYNYLTTAENTTVAKHPHLVLMHGLSGSGKSTVSQQLLESLGGIRLRSDVERKRLFNLSMHEDSDSALDEGIYTKDASEKTFSLIASKTTALLNHRFPVIVDATFLHSKRRAQFIELAKANHHPYVIVSCQPELEMIESWIAERETEGTDASEAGLEVLHKQVEAQQPLSGDELKHAVVIDTASQDALSSNMGEIVRLSGTKPS